MLVRPRNIVRVSKVPAGVLLTAKCTAASVMVGVNALAAVQTGHGGPKGVSGK